MKKLPEKLLGLEVVEELPFDLLHSKFKEHRRLRVFHQKGCQCVVPGCTRVGTRLIVTKQKQGGLHVDLYTDDFHMMTIDHTVPKCKGGSKNDIRNLEPMCRYHNSKKDNKTPEEFLTSLGHAPIIEHESM